MCIPALVAPALASAGVGSGAFFSTVAAGGTIAAGNAAAAAVVASATATIGAVTTLAGTALSVIGQRRQAQSQAAQLNYQSQVARNNQIIANQNAADIEARGKVSETLQRRQTAQLLGRQRTALAANGVVIDEGSALDITSDTERQGEFDALVVRQNTQRDARATRIQGGNFGSQADLAQTGAENISAGVPLGTASTLLTGASNVASKWDSFKKVGL